MKLKTGRYTVEITHPDRILFSEIAFSKADLANYYDKISKWLLPHIKDRALTLERYPHGITEEGFIQQNAPDSFPDFIKRARLERKSGGMVDHLSCHHKACLLFLVNQGCITFHRWLSRLSSPKKPDRLVFDLDPPSASDFGHARETALLLREFLKELGLDCYVMTTGSAGLHVVVPLIRNFGTQAVYHFAKEVAATLEKHHSQMVTTNQRRNKRNGRLYLDISRNSYGQTAVVPYTLRPHGSAPIATPLDWSELTRSDLQSKSYSVANIFRRLAQKGDPWKGMGRRSQSLKQPREKLELVLS